MYDVYRSGSAAATRQPATYYGASSAAPSQCISVVGTFQATTTDGFGTLTWLNSAGQSLAGNSALRFGGKLLANCVPGVSNTTTLAVQADTGATVLNGAMAATMVANATSFQSLECGNGQLTERATAVQFGTDKSATVIDPANGNTNFTAAQVQQIFSAGGLTLGNGTVLRWTLYVVPMGAQTRQLIVSTGTKPDGSVNVLAFLQS